MTPPGDAPSRTRPTANTGSRPNSSAAPNASRRDEQQVDEADGDTLRSDQDAPKVVGRQRQPEAGHDDRERERQKYVGDQPRFPRAAD
jgi:hypothetical protein